MGPAVGGWGGAHPTPQERAGTRPAADLLPSPSQARRLHHHCLWQRGRLALLTDSLFNWTNAQQLSLLGAPLGTGSW